MTHTLAPSVVRYPPHPINVKDFAGIIFLGTDILILFVTLDTVTDLEL